METAGDVFAQVVQRCGYTCIFTIPGIPITNALTQIQKQRHTPVIACRSEQAAANAAAIYGYYSATLCYESYIKQIETLLTAVNKTGGPLVSMDTSHISKVYDAVSGSPGICFTTSGPAFINALSGVSTAQVNCWPLVVVSSCNGSRVTGDRFQEYPQLDIANDLKSRGVLKEVIDIREVRQIVPGMVEARKIALSGVPGVVYVNVQWKVWMSNDHDEIASASDDLAKLCTISSIPRAPVKFDQIKCMIEGLTNAKKPLIIVGNELAFSAGPLITRIVKLTRGAVQIPFLCSPMGKGITQQDDPRNVDAARKAALVDSDALFIFGARLDWMFELPSLKVDKAFICNFTPAVNQVADRIGQVYNIDGDITLTFLAFMESAIQVSSTGRFSDWLKCLGEVSEKNRSVSAANKSSLEMSAVERQSKRRWTGGMKLARVFHLVQQAVQRMPDLKLSSLEQEFSEIWLGTCDLSSLSFVMEGATSMDRSRLYINIDIAKGRADTAAFAAMGIGASFAMASSMWQSIFYEKVCSVIGRSSNEPALRNRCATILLQGDSAFGFSGLEFETIGRYELPILIVVLDNGGIYAINSDQDVIAQEKNRFYQTPHLQRSLEISIADLTADFRFALLGQAAHFPVADSAESYDKFETILTQTRENWPHPALIHAVVDPSDGAMQGFVHHHK